MAYRWITHDMVEDGGV